MIGWFTPSSADWISARTTGSRIPEYVLEADAASKTETHPAKVQEIAGEVIDRLVDDLADGREVGDAAFGLIRNEMLSAIEGYREWFATRVGEATADYLQPELGFIPEGFRVWAPGDDERLPPTLGEEAFHGPLGDWLRLLEPETEASPGPMLGHALAYIGSMIGRGAYFTVDYDDVHPPIINALIVGPTGRGRKGVAAKKARGLIDRIDPHYRLAHELKGMGSGEAVVEAIQDVRDVRGEEVGTHDKRAVLVASEFSAILKVAHRDNSLLSEVLRDLFDAETIANHTRGHGRIVATAPHIAIAAATTDAELKELLTRVELANGLANRFLYLWSPHTPKLPEGGSIDKAREGKIVARVRRAIKRAVGNDPLAVYYGEGIGDYDHKRQGTEYHFTAEAREMWHSPDWYYALETPEGSPVVQGLLNRGTPYVRRLALIYAVLDEASAIGPEHLLAARAVWDYSAGTVRYIFGDGVEFPLDAKVLKLLRSKVPEALNRRDLHDGLHRHITAAELDRSLQRLGSQGLIALGERRPKTGRPSQVAVATTQEFVCLHSPICKEQKEHWARANTAKEKKESKLGIKEESKTPSSTPSAVFDHPESPSPADESEQTNSELEESAAGFFPGSGSAEQPAAPRIVPPSKEPPTRPLTCSVCGKVGIPMSGGGYRCQEHREHTEEPA